MTNGLVDRAGMTFVFRLREETGAAPADIARAYAVAREVFDMRGFWAEVEALDLEVDGRHADRDAAGGAPPGRARHALAAAQPAAAARHRRRDRAFRAGRGRGRRRRCPTCSLAGEREAFEARVAELARTACRRRSPAASRGCGDLFAALDIVGVAGGDGPSIADVAALHFLMGGRLHLHWLRDRIAALPRDNRWQAMARAALRDDLFSLHGELTADVAAAPAARRPRAPRRAWTAGSTPTGRRSSAASRSSARSATAARTT